MLVYGLARHNHPAGGRCDGISVLLPVPTGPAPDATDARLTVNLVPRTQWGANLSQALRGRRWDTLRKETYRRAGGCCEVCGGVGSRHPLEAHEVWEYNEASGVQRLVRLIALCPACHEVQHIGRAGVVGRGLEARRHLASVNSWTDQQARGHVDEAFATWRRRNRIAWTLDLSVLAEYGVTPPSAEELASGKERSRAERSRRRAGDLGKVGARGVDGS